MVTTKLAAKKLKEEILKKFYDADFGFRIVASGDGSREKPVVIKVDGRRPGDEVIDVQGVRVFLDTESATCLRGCRLDYNSDIGFSIIESDRRRRKTQVTQQKTDKIVSLSK